MHPAEYSALLQVADLMYSRMRPQMGTRSGRSRLDAGLLLDPSQRHAKARRAEDASLDASLDVSLESSADVSSTSDDEDACSTGTDLSLMSEREVGCCCSDQSCHLHQNAPHCSQCLLPLLKLSSCPWLCRAM